MGNLMAQKECKYNILLLGLQGAGKTHLLYNSQISEEGWIPQYNKQHAARVQKLNVSSKYSSLLPTRGFN